MKVAEILSDLTSLRACEYNDALSLLTVNERLLLSETVDQNTPKEPTSKPAQEETKNNHLRLASELVGLHYEMKSIHKDGRVDDELRRGREGVNRVLRELASPSSS